MRREHSSAACLGIALAIITLGTVSAQPTPAVLEPSHNQTNSPALECPPAVSAINGKLDYAGGNMNSAEGHNVGGSISFPVSHHFGFQADALYSRISDLNFYGGAGHIFWRKPDTGLLGLTGGYLCRDGFDRVNTYQAGAEGEFYWRQFTFGCFGGLGSIQYQYDAPFIDTNPTRFIGRVSADYYPLENLRVGAAFTTAFRNSLGQAEIEYQTPLRGLAVTGEVAVGDHGYDHWLVGVRYYFGGQKTLRARQRQDDPRSLMPQILDSVGTYGAEYNRKMNTYLASQTGSGGSGGSGGGVYGVVVTSVGINNSTWGTWNPPMIIGVESPRFPGNAGADYSGISISMPQTPTGY